MNSLSLTALTMYIIMTVPCSEFDRDGMGVNSSLAELRCLMKTPPSR